MKGKVQFPALLVAGLLAASLAVACSGVSASPGASEKTATKAAQTAEVRSIEAKFHQALSTKDLQLMMSLWTADATFTAGGHSYTGTDAIKDYFATSNPAFKPETNWIVLTAGWRIIATVSGNSATLHFECYFVDVPTKTVKAASGADADVVRQSAHWLIHTFTSRPITIGSETTQALSRPVSPTRGIQ